MAHMTQRSVLLALLMLMGLGALALMVVEISAPGTGGSLAVRDGIAVVVLLVLFIAARRGWRYAPHSTVIYLTLMAALGLPELYVSTMVSFALVVPPILALALLSPRWVVGSGVVEIGILLVRSDGQGVYAQGETLIIFGIVLGCLVLSRVLLDNAQRTSAQAAELTRQRDMLRFQAHLLDVVEQAVIATDINGTITYWNRFAERLFGWAAAEARGRNKADLLAVAGHEGEQTPLATVQQGNSISGKFLRRRRDGTTVPVWTTATPFRDAKGHITGTVAISMDITDRQATEAALRESEERFRMLFERSPDAIVLLDPHHPRISWPIVDCNDVACRINGYTRAELIGQSIDVLNTKPFDHAERAAYLEQLQRDGTIRLEDIHRRKDGSCFPIEIMTSLIVVAGRELVLGIERDVSDLKRAEEALQTREAQLTDAQQLAQLGSWERDLPTNTVTWSDELYRITGVDRHAFGVTYAAYLQLIHPDDRESFATLVEQASRSHDPYIHEHRIIRPDGTMRILQARGIVVVDEAGDAIRMFGTAQDITERKHAEDALRASVRLYRTLARNIPNGAVALFDHDLHFTIADGAGLADIGLSREHLEGHTIWDVFSPEECAEVVPFYRAALAGTPRVHEITRGDRAYVLHTLPVRDEHSAIIAGMLMAQEITDRKRMEQDLIAERALLARRVDERTADLSAANAELARTARLKDEFLASMSHELRTPLNAVLGLSEALQEEVFGPLNDRQRRSLHSIEESGRHLLDLITDILDLAKIGAGKLELEFEPAPIEMICQASLRLIKQLAQQKQLSIETTIDPAVKTLTVDARRVKQILLNLLSNAVKFTPAGGSIGLAVAGDAARQAVDLTVWDTGIGIAQDHMALLFQPFVQIDSRLARQYEGTGLGLALVYRMVELHGGSIAVTSVVDRGSRFTVSLPWRQADADAEAGIRATASTAIDRAPIRHALIVEDSPTTTEQITRYLNEFGVATATLAYGGDAVAQTIAEQPDLIILDLVLPDVLGWEVLAQLKAEPRTCSIPVLVVSVEDDRARGLALGAADYLVKPITRAQLYAALRTIVSQRTEQVVQTPVPVAPHDNTTAETVIILAEDNEVSITMLSEYLRAKAYRVIVARNGVEAITRAQEMRPDVILMDIQMPGMDGLEAIRRIRADGELADIPIIAMTALAMPGDQGRCLAAGANAYLSKPVSLKGLVETIETHLPRDRVKPTLPVDEIS